MWIFYVSDALLLGLAWFIASQSARPLSSAAMFAIFACIFGGALAVLVPLVARYERLKNEALDERQRELEALARTVSASAEQISIAASGLHAIAELSQKNLRHAEQLPHKLQEKIAEFQAQVANAEDAEKMEMEKDLETLRASESERLEAIAGKIARSTADWSRLEAATHQHLAAVSEAIAKLSGTSVAAVGNALAAAELAVHEARSTGVQAIEAAKAAALATIDSQAAIAAARAAADATSQAGNPRTTARARGDPAVPEEAAPALVIAAREPPPILAETIIQIAPVVPGTADPFSGSPPAPPAAPAPEPPGAPENPAGASATPATPIAPKPARKRAPRKAAPEVPDLAMDQSEATSEVDAQDGVRSGVVERVMTSDGATRLLVTAYIGIGNRLFIRGKGPGLSWEKGVPLQFVSIGKWRWETNDASTPVQFKLFKNDELECAALGSQSLDPGHQHEVTAAF